MADQTTESILFEIKINGEQYKSEQKLIRDSLGQVALDIEKTRAAQKALNDERKAGKVADADYAQQSVKLREQLKGQTADQRELEKGLVMSQKAYQSAAGSAEQLRAQLFELKTAYYAMGEAERQSAEGQGLQKQALAISDALSNIEKSVGTASRDVGKYGDGFKQGLVGVVAELVKAQAAQKTFAEGSEAAAQNQIRVAGFLNEAQRKAAQAGITDFAQATATIDQYTAAFTPAVENLVRIQQEQAQVGQSVGENSQQYQELGFKMAGAQKALDDLVSAQQAAEQASRAGGAAAQGQAAAAEVASGSLAGLRQQLLQLQATRETLDPTTQEAKALNEEILTLKTRIAEGAGQIDEFGERIQRNIKKENFDTLSDAIQGVTGATALATIVLGDNTDAAQAQAKALQLMTIAQSARAIAIGIGSAKEAALVVLMQVRNLFLKEEATLTSAAAVSTEAHAAVTGADAAAMEAQAAAATIAAEGFSEQAVAAAGSTVATEAQVVATEGATLAQQALNLAMKLNPIGLVIIAVAALVAGFYAYNNASEKTQAKVRDITKALLLFTNPLGLVYLGVEKLYNKFEAVRKVLDPVINGFNKVAGAVVTNVRAFGEYIGLLDTAAEKSAKLAALELERSLALRAQTDAEIKSAELAGTSARQATQDKIAGIDKVIARQQDLNTKNALAHQKDLERIREREAANKTLSDSDKKINEDSKKGSLDLVNLINERNALLNEGIEKDRSARQQEAADIQTNAQRAVQALTFRIQQQDAAENAQLQRNVSRIALRLSTVQKGTTEELRLQQQQVQAQTALTIRAAQQELAEKTRLRAAGYSQELASLKGQQQQALDVQGLTEQQKTEITADYAQKRMEVEQKYSLAAAKQAVAEIPFLQLQADAVKLKLRTDFERQVNELVLQSEVTRNQAQLAQARVGTVQRHDLELTLIDQEQELAIASLDQKAMSNLEYETKVTAIRADAIAKRKALSEQDTQNVITELGTQQQGAELNQQLLLAGLTESKQLEVKATKQYANERLRAEIDNYAAGLAATKIGTTERENVEKQHQVNLKNLEHEGTANQVAAFQAKYEKYSQIASQSLGALATIQDAATQDQLNRINQEMNAATTSQARKAVLAKQQQRIEKEQHERQQKYAIAQAIIDGGSAVMKILAEAPKFDGGILTAFEIAAAALTTAAQVRAISSQKFASGGIANGPSHAQGGIQLYHRGRHAGIEIEGGEPVLTAAVSRSPVLLGMASMINQLAGGRPLYRDPTPASTWARWAEGGVVSSSPEFLPGVRSGAAGQVAAPAIDYDLLTDMMAAKLGPKFVEAAQALPAQNLNLTELRERNQQLDKYATQTDI